MAGAHAASDPLAAIRPSPDRRLQTPLNSEWRPSRQCNRTLEIGGRSLRAPAFASKSMRCLLQNLARRYLSRPISRRR